MADPGGLDEYTARSTGRFTGDAGDSQTDTVTATVDGETQTDDALV